MGNVRWVGGALGVLVAAMALWAWWPVQRVQAVRAPDAAGPLSSHRAMSHLPTAARAEAMQRGAAAGAGDEDPQLVTYHAAYRQALENALRRARAGTTARDRRDAVLLELLLSRDDGDAGTALARRDQAARALVAAARAAPDDALLAWLELECRDARICDRAGAIARLQALNPDNALVWLADATLVQPGREQALDAALARASRATQLRSPLDPLSHAMPLQRVELPQPPGAMLQAMAPGAAGAQGPDIVRFVSATAVGAAFGLPSLGPIAQGCSMPIAPIRRAACEGVLRLAAAEGSFLFDGLATSRMVSLTAGTPANAAWRERSRQLAWQRQLIADAGNDAAFDPLRMRHSERDALLVWARQHGRPVHPPTGWLPDDGASRARITGRAGG